MQNVGTIIKDTRIKLGITQRQLIEEIKNGGWHISTGFLSDVENGKENISINKLYPIVATLSDLEDGNFTT